MLGQGLVLLSVKGCRFEINQPLFADDSALVADSREVMAPQVMRCLRYGNGGRIYVILNGEPLGEVDCFKYPVSQVATDLICERDMVLIMNEWY